MKPKPRATPRKPAGQPTRGKTMRNRLRRVDNFILKYDPALLQRIDGDFADALFVDLGYGAEPFTTLESAERLRRIQPNLRVLGVEIDKERVATALPYADEQIFFRLGGFNLPLQSGPGGKVEAVRLIRAFNVLRQYEEEQVAEAYALMARSVLPDGLLIEGTSDPLGRIWVANVMRKTSPTSSTSPPSPLSNLERGDLMRPLTGFLSPVWRGGQGVRSADWQAEALVFSTNFRLGCDPGEFQTVLPKNLIHRVVEGEPIHDFFQAWQRATQETAAMQVWGARQWFVASAQRLGEFGYSIDRRLRWLRQGYLIWRLG